MLNSVITNDGLGQSIIAQNKEGFFIKVKEFAVSESEGTLEPSRTTEEGTPWYTGNIAAGYKIDDNTCEVVMTIPPSAAASDKYVREIYLYGDDNVGGTFLLAIGQPDPESLFSPGGSLTFRIQIRIQNVNVGDLYQFIYTQATEINDHNLDVNAHPYLIERLNKHGIYEQEVLREWVGQNIEQFTRPTNLNTSVADKNVVYWDDFDGEYNRAIADSTIRENAIGVYISSTETIAMRGVVDYTHAYDPFTMLYLSTAVDGQITDQYSTILVGWALANNRIMVAPQNLVKYGAVVGGGGGAGSFMPILAGGIAPIEDNIDGIEFLGFSDNTQEMYFNFKIPEGYVPGNKMVLTGGVFYCRSENTGNVLMRAETALIKKGSHTLGVYSNIHSSINTEVSVPATVDNQGILGAIDLTDSAGEINGQVVEENDILRIRVFRDTDNETSSVDDTVLIPRQTFEPKKVLL